MNPKLESYRRQIDDALISFFDSNEAQAGLKLQGFELSAFNALKEFSLRPGKRIRGALTLFMYEQLTGRPSQSIMGAAIAQELIQSYLLIIDDVMDKSAKRRGKPTVHKLMAAKLVGGQERLAEMLAINTGLLAEHLAFYLLGTLDVEPRFLNQAAKLMHKNIMATVYGQIDDLTNNLRLAASEAEIIRLVEMKVSYYSFISPMQLGAVLAGHTGAPLLAEIEAYGRPAGVAFQLQDDILGLFGDEQATGKSAQDDLKEGKFTLLMLYTLERAGNDAAKVRRALGNSRLSPEEYREVLAVVKACGALAAVSAKAQSYAAKAKEELSSSSLNAESKEFLSDLIDYVTKRNN